MFEDLGSFISKLESERELVRIDKLVDPNLEITEIATRSILENKPALFFENVKGSPYPILINSLGSDRRLE